MVPKSDSTHGIQGYRSSFNRLSSRLFCTNYGTRRTSHTRSDEISHTGHFSSSRTVTDSHTYDSYVLPRTTKQRTTADAGSSARPPCSMAPTCVTSRARPRAPNTTQKRDRMYNMYMSSAVPVSSRAAAQSTPRFSRGSPRPAQTALPPWSASRLLGTFVDTAMGTRLSRIRVISLRISSRKMTGSEA